MKIDAELKKAMGLAQEVFDAMKVDSCIIGALVTHFLIALKSDVVSRQTMDVDYVVSLGSWREFDELKSALKRKGFRGTKRSLKTENLYGRRIIR